MNIRELKLREVRDVFDAIGEQGPLHIMDILFPGELPVMAVSMCSGISVDELEDKSPSEMKSIINAVKKANPFLVEALDNMKQIGQEIISASFSTGTTAAEMQENSEYAADKGDGYENSCADSKNE